jgi:hypothetical protein
LKASPGPRSGLGKNSAGSGWRYGDSPSSLTSPVFAAVSRLLLHFIAAWTAQFGVVGSTAIPEFIWANSGVSGVLSLLSCFGRQHQESRWGVNNWWGCWSCWGPTSRLAPGDGGGRSRWGSRSRLAPRGGGRLLCSRSRLSPGRGGGSRSRLCSRSRFWWSFHGRGSEGDHVSPSRPSLSGVELGESFSHPHGVLGVHLTPRLVGEVAALVAGSAYLELQAHLFGCLMSRAGQSWPSTKIG